MIDFGCAGVGDPACDRCWPGPASPAASRAAFRASLDLDDTAWARGRGWALWKALITLDDPAYAAESRQVLDEVLADAG